MQDSLDRMSPRPEISSKAVVKVLVVDDSIVFRRLLRDLIEDFPEISIVAEAKNGIEALDQVLKSNPDVILMDLEMPLMDGMTALQHLMVHRPTPTIFFSSLTREGTARAFDALKNGAVDFICKDFVFEEDSYPTFKKTVLEKVIGASRMVVKPTQQFDPANIEGTVVKPQEKVVFCEDCGTRQVVSKDSDVLDGSVRCISCGDVIYLHQDDKYRTNNFLTVITGGYGCFSNLLDLIPKLESDMTGSLICILDAMPQQVDGFSEYLASVSCINVQRGADDIPVEGGNCYLLAASEHICLKPYSAALRLQKLPQLIEGVGPMDIMIASVAKVFKSKTAVIAISGESSDGLRGIDQIEKAGGSLFALPDSSCIYKNIVHQVRKKYSIEDLDEVEIIQQIKKLHRNGNTGFIE